MLVGYENWQCVILFSIFFSNKRRRKLYLSFICIRIFPASSLAFISTTLLACSLKSETILLETVWSRSNSEREAENARAAFSVSRLYSLLIHAQASLSRVSSMDCTGPASASDRFFCNMQCKWQKDKYRMFPKWPWRLELWKIKESNLVISF